MATSEPCLFIIIGVTGDLTKRKLLPALMHLRATGAIPNTVHVLGCARGDDLDDTKFAAYANEVLDEMLHNGEAAGIDEAAQTAVRGWFDTAFHYQPIDQGSAEDYQSLDERIKQLEHEHHLPGQRVFYLALPPQVFEPTVLALAAAGLNTSAGWTRLVVEKPFGRDLASAEHLNALIHQSFDESQIYRIDHYLGKETVRNLLAFRFGNALFESLWNRDRIEHIQITAAETVGVEERAGYYEHAGALRDMVQNHLTQLLTLTAMEVPGAFDAEAIRYEKIKVLKAIAPIAPEDVVFGQYADGTVGGEHVIGYRNEPGVSPSSKIETFVALRLKINNWRWQGVPFFFRTGKRLQRRTTEIVVTFRCPPVTLFQDVQDCKMEPNVLVIKIQPDEGFDLSFEVKAPGEEVRLQSHHMHFDYAEVFGPLPEGYQTLLLDVMQGDQTLFLHSDEVESSWKLYTPLFSYDFRPHPYAAGSWGPAEGEELIRHSHAEWTLI